MCLAHLPLVSMVVIDNVIMHLLYYKFPNTMYVQQHFSVLAIELLRFASNEVQNDAIGQLCDILRLTPSPI